MLFEGTAADLQLGTHDLHMLCVAALATCTKEDGVSQLLQLMLLHAWTSMRPRLMPSCRVSQDAKYSLAWH